MPSINHTMFLGRLTSDPNVHTFDTGQVANMSVAINESYKNKKDEWETKTAFVDVKAWNRTADIAKSLAKGSSCIVEGKHETDKYKDRDGNEKSKTFVRAHRIQPLRLEKRQADNAFATSFIEAPTAEVTTAVKEEDNIPF